MESDRNTSDQWFVDEVLPYQQEIRRWLAVRFPVIRDVDDIIQETFSRAIKAHETGPIVNVRAFLYVTARNLALNIIRHYQYEQPPGEQELNEVSVVDEINSPLESLELGEELIQLKNAMASLPIRCQQIMTLRKIYGLSQKEIAHRLNIAVPTVKAQISIGMRKCMQYFREHGYIEKYQP